MAEMDVRVGKLEEWREHYVDPRLNHLSGAVDQLESDRDGLKGSLRVIIALNGIIITLVVGLILALFAWGLEHITLRAEIKNQTSETHLQQNAQIPPLAR